MCKDFLREVDELNTNRGIRIDHGKACGDNLSVIDIDESELLKLDTDIVIDQLGVTLGVNLEQIFCGKNSFYGFFLFLAVVVQFFF